MLSSHNSRTAGLILFQFYIEGPCSSAASKLTFTKWKSGGNNRANAPVLLRYANIYNFFSVFNDAFQVHRLYSEEWAYDCEWWIWKDVKVVVA
jgi:hypothetical protein